MILENSTDNFINILFVALEFPPLGGAGVQRSMKFSKYLRDYGINPIIITARETDYENIMPGYPIDFELLNELPQDLTIERIKCWDPKSGKRNKLGEWIRIFFSITENHDKLWRGELRRELPRIIATYNPRAIYVSIPPFAMAPLWIKLGKKYKLPVIMDFRDAWSQWCVSPNASIIHYKMKLFLERYILKKAASVVFTSTQTKLDIHKVHPEVNAQKYQVINNGYEGELFADDRIEVLPKEKIVIGYVGSFYYTPYARNLVFTPWWKKPLNRMIQYVHKREDWLYRSPFFFFKSLRILLDQKPYLKDKIVIRFAGSTPNWLLDQIEFFQLTEICFHSGYLNHRDVIEFQKNCDALLITSSKVLGGRDYSIAGKTYEYFTIGKPILAFVCEGQQKDILEESKMAIILDPDKSEENAAVLKKIITERTVLYPDKNALKNYRRDYLTSRLAAVIKKTF